MFYKIFGLVGGFAGLAQGEMIAIFKQVVDLVLFLAATSVTWWFGSRAKVPKVG